jgi:hypothetical protein
MRVRFGAKPLLVVIAAAGALGFSAAPAFAGTEAMVSTGSPTTPFSQNKQNEPALAVDPLNHSILVSGSNDNIDLEACNAGDPTTCPFTPGVGVSGIYFSFTSGKSWSQPTYTGWSARDCLGPAACQPHIGPIGTLPRYNQSGLASDGDPAIAFGPRPDSSGHFSWSNGVRLYYGNLTANMSAIRKEQGFKGFEAVAVSRTDHLRSAAAGHNGAWMKPVILSKQNAALFSDKDQVWADNASSSPFFGHVYACYGGFRSQEKGNAISQPMIAATSTDGGSTWKTKQVTPSTTNGHTKHGFGTSGCTIRTDSHGNVYLFYEQTAAGMPGQGSIMLVRSTNGGANWSRPQFVTTAVDTCNAFDPVQGRCVEDGVAGARDDLSPAPSVDIANGAPTGTGATNEILLTWVDGRLGLNHEKVMFTYSTDGGGHWATPSDVTRSGDRGFYSATAISPTGKTAYLTYMSWRTPFRHTTAQPRYLDDVTLRSALSSAGAPTGWTLVHRSPRGDARGASSNDLTSEFLGDYVYAIATPSYGASVWTDVRNAADCTAIDNYRQKLQNGKSPTPPAPNTDCGADNTFGNTDIFGFTTAP